MILNRRPREKGNRRRRGRELIAGSSKLEAGGWRPEAGNRKLETDS